MKIGIIGVGNMGGAIAQGLIKSEDFLNSGLFLYNRTLSKLEKFKQYNVNICENTEDLIRSSEILILAIKPNQYEEWLIQYGHIIQNKLLITVAAGINSDFLRKYTNLFSICMPNMGSSILKGYTVVCKNELINEEISNILIEESAKIFRNVGQVRVILENELSTYIGMIGSSPAYFINIINQMSEVFVARGYSKKEVEQTLAHIMDMSASLIMKEQTYSTKELINSICSPGGTTIEAVNVLNDSDISNVFDKAINSCMSRADQMIEENNKGK